MPHAIDNRCPHCGYVTEAATAVEGGDAPGPGDLSLCIECGEWSVFGADLDLRAPTDDEFMVIGEDPRCRRARTAWMLAKQQRPARGIGSEGSAS